MNNEDLWMGLGGMAFVLVILALITVIIVVVLWRGLEIAKSSMIAGATAEREDQYRRLAEQAAEAQEQSAKELQAIADGVAELRAKVATIERMMREVE